MSTEFIITQTNARGVTTITLNRPEVHNAFNRQMMAQLTNHFVDLGGDANTRVIVLKGAGNSFCAGADLEEMKASKSASHTDNLAHAKILSDMFATINACSKPLVSVVHGASFGGGTGLASVSDVVIASHEAMFGLTEVKLGLIPAVIAPYVLSKIGGSHARDLFLSGRKFTAEHALNIGLAHHISPSESLDTTLESVIADFLYAAPHAIAHAKALIAKIGDTDSYRDDTINLIATIRTGDEAQEGLDAFLNKRKPNWHAS